MKRIIFVLIAIFSLNAVTYASFPVTESPAEQLSVLNTISPVISDGPGWGILSLSLSVIGIILLFTPALEIGLILHLLAIIFGAIGFNKNLKGLAISGFVLSLISLLVLCLYILLLVLSAGAMGAAFGG
jgi:hypothetical protein